MRKLSYRYHMRLSFSEPVSRHHFTLRCFPENSERQEIVNRQIRIDPPYVGGTETDSFGNECIYGLVDKPHTEFEVDVSGTAFIHGNAFRPFGDPVRAGMYRYPTALTTMGPALEAIYEKFSDSCKDSQGFFADSEKDSKGFYERMLLLMNMVHQSLQYVQGVTQVTTTAEEAAELGMGVCQNYAHVFLALLRKERLACRYVVGMMTGEGASHAWIEVSDGEKWLEFDPTNNCPIDDHYICISHGRDARDCVINQGHFYGSSNQMQEISAEAEEISDDSYIQGEQQ